MFWIKIMPPAIVLACAGTALAQWALGPAGLFLGWAWSLAIGVGTGVLWLSRR